MGGEPVLDGWAARAEPAKTTAARARNRIGDRRVLCGFTGNLLFRARLQVRRTGGRRIDIGSSGSRATLELAQQRGERFLASHVLEVGVLLHERGILETR